MLRLPLIRDLRFFNIPSTTHRQIVLDTETTGLFLREGHRIVEIACVEMIDNKPTGKYYQQYINPERDSDPSALKVHGLTTQFLSNYPKFSEISGQFLAFVSEADLIIHNAPFDIAFINNELKKLEKNPIEKYCKNIIDTRVLAQEIYPREVLIRELINKKLIENDNHVKNFKSKNINSEQLVNELVNTKQFRVYSLDNLCKYHGIDLCKRNNYHGALIDCELLAQVYSYLSKEKVLQDQQQTLAVCLPKATH